MRQGVARRTERERVGILALADDMALADARQPLELDAGSCFVLAINSSVLSRRSGTDAPIAAKRLVYDPPPGEPSTPPSNAIQCSPLPDVSLFSIERILTPCEPCKP